MRTACLIICFVCYYSITIRNCVVFSIREKLHQIYTHMLGYDFWNCLDCSHVEFCSIDSKSLCWFMFIQRYTSSLGSIFSTCRSILCFFPCTRLAYICKVRERTNFDKIFQNATHFREQVLEIGDKDKEEIIGKLFDQMSQINIRVFL